MGETHNPSTEGTCDVAATPCPSFRLVEEKMHELELEDHDLLDLHMVVLDDGWSVTIITDQGSYDFHLDVWGCVMDVEPALAVAA